jgi:hypothetical protein
VTLTTRDTTPELDSKMKVLARAKEDNQNLNLAEEERVRLLDEQPSLNIALQRADDRVQAARKAAQLREQEAAAAAAAAEEEKKKEKPREQEAVAAADKVGAKRPRERDDEDSEDRIEYQYEAVISSLNRDKVDWLRTLVSVTDLSIVIRKVVRRRTDGGKEPQENLAPAAVVNPDLQPPRPAGAALL